MRLQGLFLRSAVARRVFWTLMAAAALPLLLFGGLGYHALAERIDAEARQVNQAMLKQIGLRVFDRLSAAKAALATHAGNDRWAQPGLADPEARSMISEIATLDVGGGLAGGSPALAAAWREASASAGDSTGRVLWWQLQGAAPARVIVGHRDSAGRGWWLAEIAPGFLWADFGPDGAAAGMCVADLGGRALRCGNDRSDAMEQPAARWSLFLEAGFGAPDWRIGGSSVGGGEHLAALAFGSSAVQGVLLTLLLVMTLSLVLVRRTMVPLEQLTQLTRRFAARDWSARASIAQGDEFGELAIALNTMAERVGRQMHAMEVHAGIDRAILDGRDSGSVMQRVAERLQALLPQAHAVVIARDAAGAAWFAHRPGAAGAAAVVVDAAAADQAPDDGFAVHCGDDVPPWLQVALPELAAAAAGRLCWVPAAWQGELVALLVVAAPQGLAADEDVLREITELRDRVAVTLAAAMREHHLVERAVRDGLTGLLNSHGMHEACERLLPGGAAAAPFSMVFVDLDAFKEVNDSLGHAAGDTLLQAVAQRLASLAPAAALLARPGGDEFVVLLPGPPGAAATLAQALCAGIAAPFQVRGQTVHVGASIGVASCPQDATDRNELMRRADLAMYAAKGEGRGRWRFYDAALDARLAEKAWIVRELRLALDGGQLQLHYQPRIDLRSRRVHSAEALLRWTHPTAGAIGPQRFIPIAEEAGLIEAIGAWVLDAALRQQRLWRDAGLDVGRVAVNVSPRQLHDDGFAAGLLALLARHGLRPADLEIEITESLFVGDVDAVCARLAPLRDAGVLVALDDFGTGYSSLAALHRLPVDVLKIDRSFVVDLGGRASADAVARSIVALARALGKRVVAEGVETETQERHLVALGCDEIQGYLYARPMPAGAFAARLQEGFVDLLAATA